MLGFLLDLCWLSDIVASALIVVMLNFLSCLSCVMMHGCFSFGWSVVWVLLLAMIVLALLVLCFGTMVPIGTIDAEPVPFGWLWLLLPDPCAFASVVPRLGWITLTVLDLHLLISMYTAPALCCCLCQRIWLVLYYTLPLALFQSQFGLT
jgi:hypothetical protein